MAKEQRSPSLDDISQLSFEEARSQLLEIVTQLEQGALPLEESLNLWEKGEALAQHCQKWLDSARDRIAAAAPSEVDQEDLS